MKKLLTLLLAVLLVLSMAAPAFAAETVVTEEITYFEDGSYLITTIGQFMSRSASTTTGFTRKTFVDAEGNTCWRAVLTGAFTYDGTTAVCTEASIEVYIYNNTYYAVSKSAGTSGASATATFTIGERFLGITVARNTYSMALTCNPNGTLY